MNTTALLYILVEGKENVLHYLFCRDSNAFNLIIKQLISSLLFRMISQGSNLKAAVNKHFAGY